MSEHKDAKKSFSCSEWTQKRKESLASCCAYLSKSAWHRRDSDRRLLVCWLTGKDWCDYSIFLGILWIITGFFFYMCLEILQATPIKGLWGFLIAFVLFVALFGVLIATVEKEDPYVDYGCKPEELKLHLGKQMTEEMTWDNFGTVWHVKHRTPIWESNPSVTAAAAFEQVCQSLHFSNTVPVLARNVPKYQVKRASQVSVEKKAEEKTEGFCVTMHN